MPSQNKYRPDPPGYKRERPTASPKHQELNAKAGPGRKWLRSDEGKHWMAIARWKAGRK